MDKLTGLLQDLATRLGTTVQHVWPLLVQKTRVDWIATTSVLLVCSVASLFLVRAAYRWCNRNRDFDPEFPEAIVLFAACAAFLFTTIGLIIQLASISELILPEAATVDNLLRYMKEVAKH